MTFSSLKHLVFYLPDETKNTVYIVRIIYGGRDIKKQLSETVIEYCETSEKHLSKGRCFSYVLHTPCLLLQTLPPSVLGSLFFPDAKHTGVSFPLPAAPDFGFFVPVYSARVVT